MVVPLFLEISAFRYDAVYARVATHAVKNRTPHSNAISVPAPGRFPAVLGVGAGGRQVAPTVRSDQGCYRRKILKF